MPKIDKKIIRGIGSIAEAVEILEGDDAPDSIAFMEKWNSLSETDQRWVRLEDVITAAGLSTRRFMELLMGSTFDHHGTVDKLLTTVSQTKVIKSLVKAATDEQPIRDFNGNVIGHTNGDVRAMEVFLKGSGFLPTPKPAPYNNHTVNQQINISTTPDAPNPERTPLESMDSFLMEIDEIRKPKQLGAGKAPEIIPDEIPDIEYLDDDDLEGAHP